MPNNDSSEPKTIKQNTATKEAKNKQKTKHILEGSNVVDAYEHMENLNGVCSSVPELNMILEDCIAIDAMQLTARAEQFYWITICMEHSSIPRVVLKMNKAKDRQTESGTKERGIHICDA